MLCMVKNKSNGELFPACAMQVVDRMEVISDDNEIKQARRESLELLLSDHVGDCEAPCRIACPAYMNIPLMNRLIAAGKFDDAIAIVKEEIALPLILGYICPAPCEKVCRRAAVDEPIAICLLKKFAAGNNTEHFRNYMPRRIAAGSKSVAIIGSGPAGLAAAYHLAQRGYTCKVFEKDEEAGGALRHHIPEHIMPQEILDKEIETIENYGVEFILNSKITRDLYEQKLKEEFDAIIIATGETMDSGLQQFGLEANASGTFANYENYTTTVPGVFACGSVVKNQRMAVRSLAQGKTAAWSAHVYMIGKTPGRIHRMFNSKIGALYDAELIEYMKESVAGNRRIPVSGKLAGFTDDEAIAEATRCMHCDCRKPHTCRLRLFSDEYQVDRRKFTTVERKSLVKNFQHDQVVYEPEKCIKCGLCVEITEREEALKGLAYIGRGFNVKIEVPFNKTLDEALSNTASRCVEACPTGALAFKNSEKI